MIFLPEDEGLKKLEERIKITKESKIGKIREREEEYIVNYYTAAWNFLDEIKNNPDLLQERLAPHQFRILKILKNRGIIKIEAERLKEINWGKFRELRSYAIEGKILELLDKNPKGEMTVNEISSELKIPISAARKRIKMLKNHNLIETNIPKGRMEIIFKKKNKL